MMVNSFRIACVLILVLYLLLVASGGYYFTYLEKIQKNQLQNKFSQLKYLLGEKGLDSEKIRDPEFLTEFLHNTVKKKKKLQPGAFAVKWKDYYFEFDLEDYRTKRGKLKSDFIIFLVLCTLLLIITVYTVKSFFYFPKLTNTINWLDKINEGDYGVKLEKHSGSVEISVLQDRIIELIKKISADLKANSRLQTIIEKTTDMVSLSDMKFRIKYINKAGIKLLGLPENIDASELKIEQFYPDWAAKIVIEEGIPFAVEHGVWQGETAIINFKGEEIPVSQVIICHRDENGGNSYLSTIIRDITGMKKYNTEMGELRSLLNDVFESMPSMLAGIDSRGNINQWNHPFEKLTGIMKQEVIGKPVNAFLNWFGDYKDFVLEAIKSKNIVKKGKIPLDELRQNGYFDITVFPVGKSGSVVRVDDVTEKIKLEELMLQSEKMLSLGGLAAGMAHEINNPLAAISQNINVVQNRICKNLQSNIKASEQIDVDFEKIREYTRLRGIPDAFDEIYKSVERASTIVRNMLDFAKKAETVKHQCNLNDLINDTLVIAEHEFDLKRENDFRKIRIKKYFADNIPTVLCEANEIKQVLLNLMRNGAQAMFEKEYSTGQPTFIFRTYSDGPMVTLEIEDNGVGLDEGVKKRIFDPFFTTKSNREGTGLGLSISFYIITEVHKGNISVDSGKNEFTRFKISLPVNLDETG